MVKTISIIERNLLLNISPSENILEDNTEEILYNGKELFNGQYSALLENEFCLSTIAPLINVNFDDNIQKAINTSEKDCEKWFYIAIASFLYFIQNNWVGYPSKNGIEYLIKLRKLASINLSMHDQCNENIIKSELLFLAKRILTNDSIQQNFSTALWWLLRINYIQQQILEEWSATLFDETENLIKKISELDLINDTVLTTLFSLEAAQFYLFHIRIQSAEKYLENAKKAAKLSYELQGAMGKRTKYQKEEKAQLYLKIKVDKELFPYRICEYLPKVINLSDDLRLEKIEFSEEIQKIELGSLEEAIILTEFFQVKLSQPKDELANEEVIPYIEYIIDNTQNWALKISALFERCILESNHKRTIERSSAQIEYLIEQINSKSPVFYRIDLFFASGMKPLWYFKKNLADLMLSLGMIKGALDLYLKLHLWEDVIVCYTILEMKHKAAEIIRQELDKKPTVKLWCLLGDATEEVKYYQKAWQLSGEKSSRVQRHWGLYYYSKQNYIEAIPHLKLSVELNNIQENVWVRLGFAALQIEDWRLAASAYRRYCLLEQSNFEVWNNLAKAYIKLGEKQRAWHLLQDAIKCNFDKWEVWDNLMIVSIDLGHFTEVIRCYHRILDIKGVHVDIQILSILSKTIINDLKDSEGNSARTYLQKTLELFGRLTASVSTDADVWRLYAELTLLKNSNIDNQKAAQFFQQAYRASVANPRWFRTVQDANRVLNVCIRLAETSMSCLESYSVTQKRGILGSAKLSLQTVTRKIRDLKWEDQSGVTETLNKVEEHLKFVKDELDKLNSIE